MLAKISKLRPWHSRSSNNYPARKNYSGTQSERYGPTPALDIHKRVSEAAQKFKVLTILASQNTPAQQEGKFGNNSKQIEPSKASHKIENFNDLNKRSTDFKSKIPLRLLQDRLEPPQLAFGLPNFTKQKLTSHLRVQAKNFCDLFSYVDFNRVVCFQLKIVCSVYHNCLPLS